MQRKMADIYSLVQPQSPLDKQYSEGDIVEIYANYDRLVDHGWIREHADKHVAELTGKGAAIINRFRRCLKTDSLTEAVEDGAGRFVDKALEEAESSEWHVEKISPQYILVENEMGVRRRYQVPVDIRA